MTAALPPDTAERLADVIHEVWDERTSEQMTTCPNHCGCRKQTDDPDAHDCGCSGPCCTDPAWWDGRSDPEAYANALLPTVAQLVADARAEGATKELRAIARAGLAATPGPHPVTVPVSYLFDRADAIDRAAAIRQGGRA